MRVLDRASGTATILRALRGQRRAHYRPPEWMRAERDRRVRELVSHAAEHVPYYRDLFRREGIDPRELSTAEDLARLPFADRSTVADNGLALCSDMIAKGELLPLHTSGTIAFPLYVHYDRRSLLETIAYSERDRAVEAALCGRRYRYIVAEIWAGGATVGSVQAFFGRTSYRPLRPRVHRIPLETPVAEVVRRLNELDADVLRANGSYLQALFRAIRKRGLALRAPRVVMYTGDGMGEEGRRLIEDDFGIPVISRYGATEAFRIGFTCEERDGFHLHDDLCHLRLVDDDGQEVAAGETGHVVISNLINRGTVVLNYRLGDVGRVVPEPCRCGRTSRRLAGLAGFDADVLELDDRLVHQYSIRDAVLGLDGLRGYQLAQVEPQRFELRLAAVDRDAYDRIASEATARVRRVLGRDVEPSFRPDLVPGSAGERIRRIVPLAERPGA